MAKTILVKPILTEKSNILTDELGQYVFHVAKTANKIEIRKAIEKMYGVKVSSVNTLRMPAKAKVRNTRTGITRGRKSAFKKAVITLAEGEELDFFGDM